MKETLEGEMRLFPADAKAAVVLKPGDSAFDGPASFVASQGSTVLGLRAIEPIGSDHLDSLSGQDLVEAVAIVSFVTNDSCRACVRNHETKELLDEMAFGGGLAGVLQAATGSPLASTRIMILTPLPTRMQPMPSPPLLALEKVPSMKHS